MNSKKKKKINKYHTVGPVKKYSRESLETEA